MIVDSRGTTRLATGNLGRQILESFVTLSEPFGVAIEVRDNVGYIQV